MRGGWALHAQLCVLFTPQAPDLVGAQRHLVGAQGAPGPAGPGLREQPGEAGSPLSPRRPVRGRTRPETSQQPWKDPLLRLLLSEPEDEERLELSRLQGRVKAEIFDKASRKLLSWRLSVQPPPLSRLLGARGLPSHRLPQPPPAGGLSGISWALPGAVPSPRPPRICNGSDALFSPLATSRL